MTTSYIILAVLALLIVIFVIVIKKEKKFYSHGILKTPFPWDKRTSLVIYAAKSLNDNPSKKNPKVVFHKFISGNYLNADGAPFLTALEANDMLSSAQSWMRLAKGKEYKQAEFSEKWIKAMISKGWTHFLYELEPPKFAGKPFTYAWASYADKNRGNNSNEGN